MREYLLLGSKLNLLITLSSVQANWQDNVGYTRLKNELGAALPLGNGVSATQVEASESSASSLNHVPLVADNVFSFTPSATPSSGEYANKLFNFHSLSFGQSGTVSGHAVRVSRYMYAANTDPNLGDATMSPRVGTNPKKINIYESTNYANSLTSGTFNETSDVSNHSWITNLSSSFTASNANAILRAFDRSIKNQDYVAFVGVNNGSSNPVPALMASSFNALAVGLTSGNHSTGTVETGLDGAGRHKPDIVVPLPPPSLDRTSWATGAMSSAASLLYDKAYTTTNTNDEKSEVIRAALMASADKSPFPNWANASDHPIDVHFGVGELDIYWAYKILDAPETTANTNTTLPLMAWDYNSSLQASTSTTTQANNYTFLIPAGCLAKFSAVTIWDRSVSNSGTPSLANLDLFLHQSSNFTISPVPLVSSSSTLYPFEHIYQSELPSGEYTLRVLNNIGSSTTDVATAWMTQLRPSQPASLSYAPGADVTVPTFIAEQLGVTLPYTLQSSDDLLTWTDELTIIPVNTTETITLPANTHQRRYYRLSWQTE